MRTFSHALRWLLGLAILAYLVRRFDFGEVWESLSGANPLWLGAALGLSLLVRGLNAVQLALAIRHQGIALGAPRAFEINAIASFYSLFLPGQIAAGAVKWHRLSKDSGRHAEVFATVLFVRLLNTAVPMLFGAAALMADPILGPGRTAWVAGALALCAGGFALALWSGRGGRLDAALNAGTLRAPWSAVARAARAFRLFGTLTPRQATWLVGLPVLGSLLSALELMAAARSLGLELELLPSLWLMSLVYALSLVPATVSGLGLREGALVYLLPQYGVDRVDALALSLLLFGITLALGLLGGLFEAREMLVAPRARQTGTPGP